MGRVGQSWLLAGALALFVFGADQLSKWWIRSNFLPGERRDGIAFLDFVRVGNKGVAFGALGGTGWLVPALTVAASVAILIWFARHATQSGTWVPTGLVIGGALGNFWDRVQRGEVTDFIKLPHWPAFNIADMAITCGVIVLVITAELNSRQRATPSE